MASSDREHWPYGTSEMAARIGARDWAPTSLGPVKAWPASLRGALDIILPSPARMSVIWGQGELCFYNDAFIALAGDRHPGLLGGSLSAAWPEVAKLIAEARAAAGTSFTLRNRALALSGGRDCVRVDLDCSPIGDGAEGARGLLAVFNARCGTVHADPATCSADRPRDDAPRRVRTILGALRSIARRTAAASATVDDYAMSLDGRIAAFARVQAKLMRDPAAGIDLAQIVADELLACAACEGRRVLIEGPPLRLRPQAAESFALAMHELATNAVRHGALAARCGRIRVAWAVAQGQPSSRLLFTWKESRVGGTPPGPTRRGFGTDLMERVLAEEFDARSTFAFEPDGLRCTIAVPLSARIAASLPSAALPSGGGP